MNIANVSTLKAAPVSAVFTGGSIYKNPSVTVPELKASGFTTVIIWTIHIDANGNFNFNAD